MSRDIEAKKGSSLFDATILSVDSVTLWLDLEGNEECNKFVYFERDHSKFQDLMEAVKRSSQIVVTDIGSRSVVYLFNEDKLLVISAAKKLINKNDRLFDFFIYSKPVGEIRALAKEIRADKAVAKAAKIPKKPKAGIKTRRDVL